MAEPAEPFAESIEDRELHVEASESYLAVRVCVHPREANSMFLSLTHALGSAALLAQCLAAAFQRHDARQITF